MKMILVFLVSFLTFSQTISSSWAKCQEATKRAYKWESLGSTGVIYPAELFPNQSMESNPTTGHIHSAYAPGREAEILVGTMPYRGSEEDIIEMLYKSDQGDLTVVSYKVKKKNWFVLSGTKDGQEVYIKTVRLKGASEWASRLYISYPVSERRLYNPIVECIEDSFRVQ